MRSIYVPAQNGSGRPDSRGCCGSWERQEGCLGGLRCGGLRAHLRKKIATARSVRRGDRLLLTRQCRPENGYHGRARGDGGERDSDPSPTKTQRQARKRRTRSQSAIARMHVAAAGSAASAAIVACVKSASLSSLHAALVGMMCCMFCVTMPSSSHLMTIQRLSKAKPNGQAASFPIACWREDRVCFISQ